MNHPRVHINQNKQDISFYKKKSGGDKMDKYFLRSLILSYYHINILVSFAHHSNIIAAALGLEALLPSENSR